MRKYLEADINSDELLFPFPEGGWAEEHFQGDRQHLSKTAVSASVIVLEGSDVGEMFSVSARLGHPLEAFTVPITFPPYLPDADQHLQRAHCVWAAGADRGAEAVISATCEVTAELIADSSMLIETEKKDFRETSVTVESSRAGHLITRLGVWSYLIVSVVRSA